MTINTKYNIGDKVYIILKPSMRGGGRGWECVKATVYFVEIFYNSDGVSIEYTFKESYADNKYESNIFDTKEEGNAKIENIISKLA
jgi:hypothetical protein